MWEKKKLLVIGDFFFSHNVFYSIRKLYPHLSIFITSYLSICCRIGRAQNWRVRQRINSLQNNKILDWTISKTSQIFLGSWEREPLKTWREMDRTLVFSILPSLFPQCLFYNFTDLSRHFCIISVTVHILNLRKAHTLSSSKDLALSQTNPGLQSAV